MMLQMENSNLWLLDESKCRHIDSIIESDFQSMYMISEYYT